MLGLKVKGFTVEQVLVEEQLDIANEFYAGVIVDDRAQAPLVIFSSVGGTGIEEIAVAHPDKVARLHVDIKFGLQDYQARNLVRKTGLGGRLQRDLGGILEELVALVREKIGPVAAFKKVTVVERLPKTRSGKILRGTMKSIADGKAYKMPATIDDPAILGEIEEALQGIGYAKGE